MALHLTLRSRSQGYNTTEMQGLEVVPAGFLLDLGHRHSSWGARVQSEEEPARPGVESGGDEEVGARV